MPASVIRKMGKAKQPQFFEDSIQGESKPSPITNLPMMLLLVAVGVGVILFLRSRSSAQTGPALTIVQPPLPDQSTIDNLTASIMGLQQTLPSGGTSTPIAQVHTTAQVVA